jgi:hypothetical protein
MQQKTNVTDLWNRFFNVFRANRFGANNEFDVAIVESNSGRFIYKGGCLLGLETEGDRNQLQSEFNTFLEEQGFTPDNANPLLGSTYKGNRLEHWLRYSHPEKEDLWVNYFSIESVDGPVHNLSLTNRPENIKNPKFRNYASARQLEQRV